MKRLADLPRCLKCKSADITACGHELWKYECRACGNKMTEMPPPIRDLQNNALPSPAETSQASADKDLRERIAAAIEIVKGWEKIIDSQIDLGDATGTEDGWGHYECANMVRNCSSDMLAALSAAPQEPRK